MATHLGSLLLPPPPSGSYGHSFEGGRCTIKHKHRPYAVEHQPADPPEEAQQVAILDEVPIIITHGIEKLVNPYRSI
jgi:hypothetical protein